MNLATKPKRVILFIADLAAGGAERVVSILANTWSADEAIEVLVVVLFDTTPFYELDPRVRYISLGMTPNESALRRLANLITAVSRLRVLLRRERPAFVLSFIYKYNVFCLAATLGAGVPIIVSERDNPLEDGLEFIWLMRRIFYPAASGLITQSEMSRRVMQERTACKDITIIPNPVDPLAVADPAARENIILNVGRLFEKKGQSDLLRAFAALDAPGWRLVICGDGPTRQTLQALARTLGVADRVTFTGAVSDVGAQLRRARIFAFPSYSEGFPNALAEAMLAGLPCVSYDCPTGPSEIIQNGVNGYLVELGGVRELQDRLQELIADDSRAGAMGSEARKVQGLVNRSTVCERYFDYCMERAALSPS